MIRNGLMRSLLTVSLVITSPASVVAQDDATGPEGERWDLVAYGVDGLGPVPWNIDATLFLDGGLASGATGCGRFSGDYEVAAEALTFPAALEVTRGMCVGDTAAVAAGYLAALDQVATWAIVDEELQLSDADGTVILVGATTENPFFEVNAPLRSRSTLFRLEPLGRDDIQILVVRGLAAEGASSMKDMGKVMGLVKAEAQGRADMGKVSAAVKERLSAA